MAFSTHFFALATQHTSRPLQHSQTCELTGVRGRATQPNSELTRELTGARGLVGDKALLVQGGRKGRGNASFKTSTNKAPIIAEEGEEGASIWLNLELKLVADAGIIGVPNAGAPMSVSFLPV